MIICPEHLELIPKGKVIMASKMSEHLDIDKAYYYRLSFETFMFLYFLWLEVVYVVGQYPYHLKIRDTPFLGHKFQKQIYFM